MKTRTERYAMRQGHPEFWTSDNVADAQTEANAKARLQDQTGPTLTQLWQTRRSITRQKRRLFQDAVQQQREGLGKKEDLPSKEQRRMQREAIRRALVEHGILLFSRRRIPLPIMNKKTATIS